MCVCVCVCVREKGRERDGEMANVDDLSIFVLEQIILHLSMETELYKQIN